MRRIFISVAEASADEHAAALIERARDLLPDCSFYGLAGPRMVAAGAASLGDLTGRAVMLGRVLTRVGEGVRTIRRMVAEWRRARPDLVVLLDSSALNLGLRELNLRGLAGCARRMGIPVLYYIAPQTWASRTYREGWLRRDVTRIACIFPFEEQYFRGRCIAATYVGQPVIERVRRSPPDPRRVAELRAGAGRIVALLPGSRSGEIRRMLPLQLEVLRQLHAGGHVQRALISCADPQRLEPLGAAVAEFLRQHTGAREPSRLSVELLHGENQNLIAAADLVLVKSGTGALIVAQQRKPMIVLYQGGRWGYRLVGRRLLCTPHLSIPNILAGRRIVPELMIEPRPEDIVPLAVELLADGPWRRLMMRQLDEVVRPLEAGEPSRRVCEIIGEMLK